MGSPAGRYLLDIQHTQNLGPQNTLHVGLKAIGLGTLEVQVRALPMGHCLTAFVGDCVVNYLDPLP